MADLKERRKELRAKRREFERESREIMREERRAQAREKREEARAAMVPEALEIDAVKDKLYAKVFDNDDGAAVLADLELSRPVVADQIKERIARAKP